MIGDIYYCEFYNFFFFLYLLKKNKFSYSSYRVLIFVITYIMANHFFIMFILVCNIFRLIYVLAYHYNFVYVWIDYTLN